MYVRLLFGTISILQSNNGVNQIKEYIEYIHIICKSYTDDDRETKKTEARWKERSSILRRMQCMIPTHFVGGEE